MTTESVTIKCTVQNDARLLVGLRTIFSHATNRVGLEGAMQGEFTADALDTCRQVLALAKRKGYVDPTVQIVIGQFVDRIEVAMEYPGELLEAAGSRTAHSGSHGKTLTSRAIDSIEGESRGARSCVRLTKYVGVAKPK